MDYLLLFFSKKISPFNFLLSPRREIRSPLKRRGPSAEKLLKYEFSKCIEVIADVESARKWP